MTTQAIKTTTMTYGQAVCDGMAVEMRRDPTIYVAGEDVGMFGGGLGVTLGLIDEFGPKRVRNTPLSETAIVGHAVGAAMAGLRPIAEIMFDDFLGIVLDELGNQAAKARYMFGGKVAIPMVLRASCGAGIRAAAQHSQSLEAWCAHVPGLKTVAPSTPVDAKGLIIAAVRDDNPVVFLEHKTLLNIQGEVPEGEYIVPIGKAEVKRQGGDVTIVAWSAMVAQALAAAEALAAEGVSAEVIDLRTIVPFDKEAVLESVAKTNRLVIVHEAVRTAGFGAEVAAVVAGEGLDLLDAPIVRVTAPDTPVPFSPVLEDAYLPNADKIKAAVLSLL
ncbi:MAG: alpha-ketoacid dehydrogenase subunit beta [Thermoleophilia bacterium]|nr:alpha-ketoacid dehydrogenase subunit beta [Thermoleophilia bacterium]